MKKLFLLFFFVTNSLIFGSNLYFYYPQPTTYEMTQYGNLGIPYHLYTSSCFAVTEDDDYFARLYIPGEGWTNWQVGEIGGWWVTKAGTYKI